MKKVVNGKVSSQNWDAKFQVAKLLKSSNTNVTFKSIQRVIVCMYRIRGFHPATSFWKDKLKAQFSLV